MRQVLELDCCSNEIIIWNIGYCLTLREARPHCFEVIAINLKIYKEKREKIDKEETNHFWKS